MVLSAGAQPAAVYVGSTAATAVYVGATLAWSAAPATSPPAFRSASSGVQQAAANTDISVPLPTGVQAGDRLVLIMMGSRFLDSEASIGDPTGWTRTSANSTFSGSAGRAFLFTRQATGSDTDPVVVPILNGDAAARVAAILAYDTAGEPTNIAWGGSGSNSTSLVAPSTTGVVDGLLVSAWMQGTTTFIGGDGGTTTPGGMTERADVYGSYHVGVAAADEPLSSTAATGTRTATRPTSLPYVSLSFVLPPGS
jgi:hypothetical protein